jgi:hypothetical protein
MCGRTRERAERSTLGSTMVAAPGMGLAAARKAGAAVKQPEGGRRAWSAQSGKKNGHDATQALVRRS